MIPTYEHLKWEYWNLNTRHYNLDIMYLGDYWQLHHLWNTDQFPCQTFWIYETASQNVNKILHYFRKNRFTFRIFLRNSIANPFLIIFRFRDKHEKYIISKRNLSVQFHSCKSREMDRCRIYVFRLDLAKQWSKIGSLIA